MRKCMHTDADKCELIEPEGPKNDPALNEPALLCKSDLEFALCLKMLTL